MPVGAFPSPTHTTVTVTVSSTQVLVKNGRREYAAITNTGEFPIYFALGTAAVVGKGWMVSPGGVFELLDDDSDDTWIGDEVYAIADGGSVDVACAEVIL